MIKIVIFSTDEWAPIQADKTQNLFGKQIRNISEALVLV